MATLEPPVIQDNLTDSQKKRAKLWFYARDIGAMSSSQSGSTGGSTMDSLGLEHCFKHWAYVLDYMKTKKDSSEVDKVNKRILYEANNKKGLLVARDVQFGEEEEEEEWIGKPGFSKKDHGEVYVNEEWARKYCENFNKRNIKYVATKENCQMFLDEFLSNVLTDSAIVLPKLPIQVNEAKSWFSSGSSMLLNSLTNIGSAAIIKVVLLKTINGTEPVEWVLKEVIRKINLNGIGKISILKEGPIAEFIAKEGKQLVLAALGEGPDKWMNFSKGACSLLNLLQIPVELIVGKLMKSAGFTNLQVYGGKKLASCLTAAGVGFVAAGPFGVLGSLAFWIAAEIVATMVKLLLGKIFGESFTTKFGGSETIELTKSIYRYFEIKISCGLIASAEWMMDYGLIASAEWILEYLEKTQNRTKKIA